MDKNHLNLWLVATVFLVLFAPVISNQVVNAQIGILPPQPPTGLTATAISTSQINLSWTAPANNGGSAITGYKIERSTDGVTFTTIVVNSASTSTTYSDTGLAASTAYTYRVSAINLVGTSSPSNTASATTSSGAGSTISLNTNTANVGTGVRVTGTNFAPRSQITLAYDGTPYVSNSTSAASTTSIV